MSKVILGWVFWLIIVIVNLMMILLYNEVLKWVLFAQIVYYTWFYYAWFIMRQDYQEKVPTRTIKRRKVRT